MERPPHFASIAPKGPTPASPLTRNQPPTSNLERFSSPTHGRVISTEAQRSGETPAFRLHAVAPPTFVLFTDKDVKLHFAFERFLANQIRANFGFIGAPTWFKTRPRNKKKPEE